MKSLDLKKSDEVILPAMTYKSTLLAVTNLGYKPVLVDIDHDTSSLSLNHLEKKITDATCGYRAFRVDIFKNKIKYFNKRKYYTYGFEYYSYGKILNSSKIKSCEASVSMSYDKKNKYSHIRPVVDWVPII